MVIGLNRSLYWFFNFRDAPLMSYSTLIAFFCVVNFKHNGEMKFSGEFCKNTVNPTPSLFKSIKASLRAASDYFHLYSNKFT